MKKIADNFPSTSSFLALVNHLGFVFYLHTYFFGFSQKFRIFEYNVCSGFVCDANAPYIRG